MSFNQINQKTHLQEKKIIFLVYHQSQSE